MSKGGTAREKTMGHGTEMKGLEEDVSHGGCPRWQVQIFPMHTGDMAGGLKWNLHSNISKLTWHLIHCSSQSNIPDNRSCEQMGQHSKTKWGDEWVLCCCFPNIYIYRQIHRYKCPDLLDIVTAIVFKWTATFFCYAFVCFFQKRQDNIRTHNERERGMKEK